MRFRCFLVFSGDVSEPEALKPQVLLGDDWMAPVAPTYVQSFTSKKEEFWGILDSFWETPKDTVHIIIIYYY